MRQLTLKSLFLIYLLVPQALHSQQKANQLGELFYSNSRYDILEFIVQKDYKLIVEDQVRHILILGPDNLEKMKVKNNLVKSLERRCFGLREYLGGISYSPVLYGNKQNIQFTRGKNGYKREKVNVKKSKKSPYQWWHRKIVSKDGSYSLKEVTPTKENDFTQFSLSKTTGSDTDTLFVAKDPNYRGMNVVSSGDYEVDFALTRLNLSWIDSRKGLFYTSDRNGQDISTFNLIEFATRHGVKIRTVPYINLFRTRLHYDTTYDMLYVSLDVMDENGERRVLLTKIKDKKIEVVPYKEDSTLFPNIRIMDAEHQSIFFLNIDTFGSRSIFRLNLK